MKKSSFCLFSTFVYSAKDSSAKRLNGQLLREIQDIRSLDLAAKHWSKENYKNGFTTYASGNNLHQLSPNFQQLEKLIDGHVKKYSKVLDWNLGGRKLKMNTCWVNVMEKNTHHSLHLHPLSVVSGTYYVSVPKGASGIKFEDPRLSSFMGSPPRNERAKKEMQNFFEIEPKAGSVVLFESWLRHEVPLHAVKEPRISISFNYDWE
jgi:uncharacterized protein (TIGR02466 family)